MLAVVIKGSYDLGGFANVWSISNEGQRIEFFKCVMHISLFRICLIFQLKCSYFII